MERIDVVNRTVNDYLSSLEDFDGRIHHSLHQLVEADELAMKKMGRHLLFEPPPGEHIVMTTYFTSKPDPQRNITIEPGRLEYIRGWHDSLKAQNLKGVVFTDFRSQEFFKQFSSENLKFISCTLGDYSLNDERYYFYYSYLLRYYRDLKMVFLTDGNDVTFLKSPFDYVASCHPASLFIGRNNTSKIIYSEINKRRLDCLANNFNLRVAGNFYLQPVYNAGIIGGHSNVVLYFLTQLRLMLEKFSSAGNMNMILLNLVIFQYFCPHVTASLVNRWVISRLPPFAVAFFEKLRRFFLGKNWNAMRSFDHMNDYEGNTNLIRTSYPLHNAYKSYKAVGGEFMMHK